MARTAATRWTTLTSPWRSPELVADGTCRWGIVVDGAGIGSAMAANKVPGVRAANCHDLSSARNSREHNYANVLTLGARFIGEGLALDIVKTWLDTEWGAERHGAPRRQDQRDRTLLHRRTCGKGTMTDTIDSRNDLVEAITREVLAALGEGPSAADPNDPCASCLQSCAAQCSTKVRSLMAERCRPHRVPRPGR